MSEPIAWTSTGPNLILQGDNLDRVAALPDEAFQLIYLDPPFNTGKRQARQSLRTVRSETGSRIGFQGHSYETVRGVSTSYNDTFDDYWSFLGPRLTEAHRLLAPTGTLYLHLDYRESHYAKVLLDDLFGPDSFRNEIIWAYDYGARTRSRWPSKHDNILVYAKDPKRCLFNANAVAAERYVIPGEPVTEQRPEPAAPPDVWWHTIVSPTGREKTGYATQKPLGILRRIIRASSQEGDWVLDFFAGSGTTGAAAAELGRRFVLVDENPDAIRVMTERFGLDRGDRDGEPVSTVIDGQDSAGSRAPAHRTMEQ